jgi:hypothetical protein
MLPVEVRIIPTFEVMVNMNLINSMAGLTVPLMASATATLLFRQFFLTIPDEYVEAAKMDGAGPIRFFKDVVLPLSVTNIAALFVILFIYGWNQYLWPLLMVSDRGLETIGAYRRHNDAMQIVSGRIDRPTVHFEAPPSARVQGEMEVLVDWFNRTAPDGPAPLPALTRAALGHLWFESIHPFEDGNGRLGRALAEKSLAQNIGQPSLIALAFTIERDRKGYYDQLETHQKTLDVTDWVLWFADIVLKAQQVTLTRVGFFIAKAKFYDQFRDQLNDRQAKVIERMFREGPDGFKGGLSAENYIAITGTSRATTTRDLQDLVEMGALSRTGERRNTRYWLHPSAS